MHITKYALHAVLGMCSNNYYIPLCFWHAWSASVHWDQSDFTRYDEIDQANRCDEWYMNTSRSSLTSVHLDETRFVIYSDIFTRSGLKTSENRYYMIRLGNQCWSRDFWVRSASSQRKDGFISSRRSYLLDWTIDKWQLYLWNTIIDTQTVHSHSGWLLSPH